MAGRKRNDDFEDEIAWRDEQRSETEEDKANLAVASRRCVVDFEKVIRHFLELEQT